VDLTDNERKEMKTIWTSVFLSIFLWCSTASAEYCTVKPENNSTSCIFTTKRNPKDAQIVVSYTQQGWSMMIAVFLKEDFAMIEGDSKVKIKKGDTHSLQYVSTRRDMTTTGRMMEAPIYMVTEAALHDLSNAKGKVRFWLTADDPKEVEVEFAAGLLEDLDAYVAETKMVLKDLFEDE